MAKRIEILTLLFGLSLVSGLAVLSVSPASAAIDGTNTCGVLDSPTDTTLTTNLSCDGDVFIDGGSILYLGNNISNVTLEVTGTICIGADVTAPCSGLSGNGTIVVNPPEGEAPSTTIIAANVVIGLGSVLHADGTGCPSSESYDPGFPGCDNKGAGTTPGFGEGGDDSVSTGGGGGAGYGGPGGAGWFSSPADGLPGNSYGSTELPVLMLGSGGGENVQSNIEGGAGGGAFKLTVSGILTNNGRISTDGLNGKNLLTSANGGGGSGGSLLIDAGTLSMGAGGVIRTNGGSGGPGSGGTRGAGGGGGGRVRVNCVSCPLFTIFNLQATGGSGIHGASPGSAGSLLVVDSSASPPSLTLGGNAVITDSLDGSSDGTHNYTKLTIQFAGATGNIQSQGTSIVNGNLHVNTALDFAGGVTVNGNFTSDAPTSVSAGISTINGNLTLSTPGLVLTLTGGELDVGGDIAVADTVTVGLGSILRMSGDHALSAATVDVSGELVLDADGVNPAQPYSLVQVATLTINPGGAVHADGTACGPSQSFDHATTLACVDLGAGVTAGFGEGGDTPTSNGAGGGGFGNLAGNGSAIAGGSPYGSIDLNDLMPGSGGGNNSWSSLIEGGGGGGAVKIEVSGTLTLDGELRSNGDSGNPLGAGPANSGGGSGGGLFIDAATLTLGAGGLIQANGGPGGTGSGSTWAGGSGSGGRIRIDCGSCPVFTPAQLQAMGGETVGANINFAGGVGSILVVDRSVSPPHIRLGGEGTLNDLIDGSSDGVHQYGSVTAVIPGTTADKRSLGTSVINGDLFLSGTLDVSGGGLRVNGDTAAGPVQVGGIGQLTFDGDATAGAVQVSGGGILTLGGLRTLIAATVNVTGGAGAKINSLPGTGFISIYSGDITVEAGNFIEGDLMGCGSTLGFNTGLNLGCTDDPIGGPGQGMDHAFSAGGAGYGGAGGQGGNSGGAGGAAYGTPGIPLALGSGGGVGTSNPAVYFGGPGGGAIYIDSTGTLTLNGTISSSGGPGASDVRTGGGGSGGGIYVAAQGLAGAGAFIADGGKGGDSGFVGGGGGGGGGRIALNYTGSDTFSIGGTISCAGGAGGAGTAAGVNGAPGSCPPPALIVTSTIAGDGTDPVNSTVEPGSTGQFLDQFSLSTNSGVDSVSGLTLTTTNTAVIADIEIWDEAMTVQYFSTVSVPAGNDWSFSGGPPISARLDLQPDLYRVVVRFKNHALLGPGVYPVTGTVTALTASNTPVLQDTDSATITVDNSPPADVGGLSGTPGDTQIILDWTNPGDSDFADVLILRDTAAVGDSPTEGQTYLAGGILGSSTVVYAGADQALTDTGLANGTAYHYRVFTRDIYNNYSAGVAIGPLTPNTILCSSLVSPITTDYTCTGDLNIAGGAVFDLIGDIRFTVNGNINVTGAGSRLAADPDRFSVWIQADNLTVGPGASVDSDAFGCGPSMSYDYTALPPVCISLSIPPPSTDSNLAVSNFGEGGDDRVGNRGAGGGGFGGGGGPGSLAVSGEAGNPYGTYYLGVLMPGSGGGNHIPSGNPGGSGGGALLLEVAGTVTVDGRISADGADGLGPAANDSGGGSGGSLKVIAGGLAGTGTLQANGGDGGDSGSSGGGSGGRVYMNIASVNTFTGAYYSMGGLGRAKSGTVFVRDGSTVPVSLIAGGSMAVDDIFDGAIDGTHNYADLILIPVGNSGDPARDEGVVEINGNLNLPGPYSLNMALKINGDSILSIPQLTVSGTGELIFDPDGNTPGQPFSRIIAASLTVDSGGVIHTDGGGCGSSLGFDTTVGSGCVDTVDGPGQGIDAVLNGGGGGGGFGGIGGKGGSVSGGAVYGSADLPAVMPGSGGGEGDLSGTRRPGGTGGGGLRIDVSGAASIDGEIRSTGTGGSGSSYEGGAGSGGSVFMELGSLTGSGTISANGGTNSSSNRSGGGGGGGRVRINSPVNNFSGICEAKGGFTVTGLSNGEPGSDGTVMAGKNPDGVVDGNGVDSYGLAGTGTGGTSLVKTKIGFDSTVQYDLHIRNLESVLCTNLSESYQVSWSPPGPGWTITVFEEGVLHNAPFTTQLIKASTERKFVVSIIPSSTALPGVYDLVFDLASTLDPTLVDSVRFRYRVSGVDGEIDGNGNDIYGEPGTGSGGVSARSVDPGVTTAYSLAVQNDGLVSQDYTLSWNTPAGWPVGSVVVNDGVSDRLSPFNTPSIGPGAVLWYTLKVTPDLLETATQAVILDLVSILDPADVDSIRAVARMTSPVPASPTVFPPLSAGETGLKLFWIDASDNETGFRIKRAPQTGGACDGDESYVDVYTLYRDPVASAQTGEFLGRTDSGLSPGTTYCYLFQAFNAAGNSPDAGPVSGMTDGTGTDSDPPGTVFDLKVLSGSETENSITVFWIAPPDDSLVPGVGQAASYDLRYSTLRIVDGVPGAGEIDFGSATPVAGLPAPGPAGSGELATVAGLAPDTRYFFSLKAMDENANISAMSNLASGMTLPTPVDPEAPDAVIDLTVVPGSQRSNSMILSWTAPSDDASVPGVGQGAIYHLRYSTSPIVDGGAVPPQIDFSGAVELSDLSAPQLGGSLEEVTVNGLLPNTIYYFALKTEDEAGNVSPMSNLAGGDNATDGSASGRTALRSGFNLVTVPFLTPAAPPCVAPDPADPALPGDHPWCVLGDDIGRIPALSRWFSNGLGLADGCYEASPLGNSDCAPPGEITAFSPGNAYFLVGGGSQAVMDVPAVSVPVTPLAGPVCTLNNVFILPVEIGWNIIGDPFIDPLVLNTVYVRQNGGGCLSFSDAVTNGWVGNTLYEYNGLAYDPLAFSAALLEPWKGYWLFVRNSDVVDGNTYELIIPMP